MAIISPGRHRLALIGALLALGLITAGLTAGRAVAGSSSPRYRLATASIGSVDQTLTEVGTVSAVNRATVSFPVAGTVAAVDVALGSRVTAGQVLANLATTSLDQQLAAVNATLAGAKQTLAADELSQTETSQTQTSQAETSQSASQAQGTGATQYSGQVQSASESAVRSTGAVATLSALRTARSSASPAPGGAGKPAKSISQLAAAVTAAQQAVLAAQRTLDADLAAAEQALASCQSALSQATTPTPSASPSPSGSATTEPTGAASSSTSGGAASDGSAQCLAAIGQAPDQQRAAADQQARAGAESRLDAAIRNLLVAASKAANSRSAGGSSGQGSAGSGSSGGNGSSGSSSSGSSSSGGNSRGSSNNSSSGSGFGGSSRTGSGPASAEQLAADQAQIDAAQAQQAVARQNLAATVLTSPLDGVVGAISIVAGKAVGSSSASASITVIGAGAEQVSTTVGLADIDSVHAGELATVRVDGQSTPLTGKVSLVGILNSTSGSSTSYPVTIVLDQTSARLFDGSGAAVQLEVARVSGVLTVPSSAVHALGRIHTVEVLVNGKPTVQPVTLGAVGSDRTEVRSGLTAGQQVVLADLAEPLPTGR